jgi:YggT family protein
LFILRLASALIVVYLILISLRLILTWFQGSTYGRSWELLRRATDPYLGLFSGLRFLRRGVFDFTPIAAILVLVVALDLLSTLQRFGTITLGVVLASVVAAAWSGLAFLLVFFLILAAIKAILLLLRRDYEGPLTSAISLMVEPVVSVVRRVLPVSASLSESAYLFLTVAVLLVLRLVGGFLVGILRVFLVSLPV